MEERAKRQWDEISGNSSVSEEGWLDGLFEGATQEAERAITALCRFAGYKVLFVESAHVTLHKLYVGSVRKNRAQECLADPVNMALGALMEIIPEELREPLARGFLEATVRLWEFVVLNGGPLRAFAKEDAEVLEEDLTTIRELFEANGEGLDPEEVHKSLQRPSSISTLMALDTDVLTSAYESGVAKGRQAKRHPSLGEDPNILLRILCHRNERAASKYLKNHFNLPKRLRV